MYKITCQNHEYTNAMELIFDGVTSLPPSGVKLVLGDALPARVGADIRNVMGEVLGDSAKRSGPARESMFRDAEVTRFSPDAKGAKTPVLFSKTRDAIRQEFLHGLAEKNIRAKSWVVAEVPLPGQTMDAKGR